ncbi:MAG: ligase-associated DNA damage response exonuclease [Myxococcales bacterium]
MLTETAAGLFCARGGFHLDPVAPVSRAVVTHAHADHARPGSGSYLCAEPSLPLLRRRLGPDARIEGAPYGVSVRCGEATLSFHPAGHILGAAQVRIEDRGEVWVFSGDYKREADPTCAPFEPVRCDTFVTESTFALPIFRWEEPRGVVGDILSWWRAGAAEGRSSVLFVYALGKAQRILGELARLTDQPVFVHGMLEPYDEIYRAAGAALLPTRLVVEEEKGRSFAGELVLAPLPARGTTWMRRLGERQEAFASGFMQLRGTRRRRSFDRGFALSDHADWPSILRTVRETAAERVYATHGHRDALVRYLREQGLAAAPLSAGLGAEPDPIEGD